MNYRPWLGALLLGSILLAGCDMAADTNMMNGAIALKGDKVMLRPEGQPEGVIDSSGNFAVDGKPVNVTPQQQALLMAYYMNVADVHNIGLKMGKVGGTMAVDAIAHASSSKEADDRAAKGADELQTLGIAICKDTAGIKTVQDQLAAQLPAFKPYAGIVDRGSVDDCAKDMDKSKGKDAG